MKDDQSSGSKTIEPSFALPKNCGCSFGFAGVAVADGAVRSIMPHMWPPRREKRNTARSW
jgi:hypothetical protein